jgi:glycosyltransferase involved in cell wall biosynthesis
MKIKMHVCFYWGIRLEPFSIGSTTYYPIFRNQGRSKIARHINKYFIADNDKSELKQLLKIIETVSPDVVHIHGTEDNFGLVQRLTNIPTVISIQGLLSPYTIKYFSGISRSAVRKFTPLKTNLTYVPILLNFVFFKKRAIRERQILALSKNIIGRTDWDKRVTRVLAPGSNYFIGNEMLRPSFYLKQWNRETENEKVKIVSVMGGAIYKGLETVVETARIIAGQKLFPFKWYVVGLNKQTPSVQIVSRWLKTKFIDEDIEFTGSLNEVQLSDLLIKADIYCQCSHIENSSNSLCEAMLLGMPIVASFAGGTDSILENRKEGLLVQDGDYYSFAGAIKSLVDNPIQAVEFASNARQRAVARHNPERIVNELINCYNAINNA